MDINNLNFITGSNLESDEEPLKQVPLNEEEVAVLESYLEQWDLASSQERNVIWKDATTEARLKAPKMDKNLLRSRKMVYRKWLQNHREKKKDTTSFYQSREEVDVPYLMDMVNSLTEKEIEDATVMARQWNMQGVPLDVQADTARWNSEDLLQYVASKMFKKAGMWLFILSAWKDEEGKLMVSRWWSKAKKEVRPLVRWHSKREVVAKMAQLPTKGKQVKSGAQMKSRKKSMVQATAQSDSSEDADAQIQGHIIKTDKWQVGKTCLSKKVRMSMDVAESDHASESSSDEIEMTALVNMHGRTSGKGGSLLPPPQNIQKKTHCTAWTRNMKIGSRQRNHGLIKKWSSRTTQGPRWSNNQIMDIQPEGPRWMSALLCLMQPE
ncbi:uncharacterized protein F5147DRAFT_649680 [Suillus discolor]|uniref:Uncharacterized protein n=1 Tax=Suillus discolor TaxID=1912936 RepID=A0A9P7FDY6_9AGAM|nr:uncharacterized protein F5147DRAFT_649680 [Suillus discolor]KAG2115303.1 hypothetical protein F5147DRAFT_649680 [Suillus discolor]